MRVPVYAAKAQLFRMLAHPARIRVLELLSEGDRAVHELRAAIEIEQSNLSQQLSVLRLAGVVTQRREGRDVVYALAIPEVRDLLAAGRRIVEDVARDNADLVDDMSRRSE